MSIDRWSEDMILMDLPPEVEKQSELQTVIEMLREGGDCDVVIDFSQVNLVGGECLTQLLELRRLVDAGGHKLTLCHVSPVTKGIFSVAHLDDLFEFAEDEFTVLASSQAAGMEPLNARARLRVLLADDHEVMRHGLASLLSEDDTVEVVGEAGNGRDAVDLAGRLCPDVVVMDVSMPVMDGDEATRRIKKDLPRTRIVALSMWEEPAVREKMYQAGAESYVLKTASSEELLAAIRGESQVYRGIPCESIV